MLKNTRILQFAWFTTGAEIPASKLFYEMFGREADAFQRLQPPQAPFPLTVHALVEGNVEHKLQVYTGRVDYFVSAVQQSPELPFLPGSPDSLLSAALVIAKRAAELIGNINRAAVILHLSEKIDTVAAAGSFFTKLFGGSIQFSKELDVQFQMNRRMSGQFGKVDINRLLRWSADTLQIQQMINLPGVAGPGVPGALVDLMYLNYMIDINTVPTSEIFSPTQHEAVFAKLADIALAQAAIEKIQDISNGN